MLPIAVTALGLNFVEDVNQHFAQVAEFRAALSEPWAPAAGRDGAAAGTEPLPAPCPLCPRVPRGHGAGSASQLAQG